MDNRVGINIWDDYKESEGTYIVVEDSRISQQEQKRILEALLPQLQPYFGPNITLSLNLYDTKKAYPDFNRSAENIANTGWRDWNRWEIRVSAISYEDLEKVLYEKNLINTTLPVLDYQLFFYSES